VVPVGSRKDTVEAGIKFDILSDGAPSENMPGVEGIDSLASCESWLDAVAIGKLPYCCKDFANNEMIPKPSDDVVSSAIISSFLFDPIPGASCMNPLGTFRGVWIERVFQRCS